MSCLDQVRDLRDTLVSQRRELLAQEGDLRIRANELELVIDRLSLILTFAEPEPEPPGTRHSVQRPVMALFRDPGDVYTEAAIIAETRLPAPSVHKFLLSAVVAKKLVREHGVYSLPKQEVGAS